MASLTSMAESQLHDIFTVAKAGILYMDCFVRRNATDGERPGKIQFTDTVISSPVHRPSESVYNLGTMHKDKPNTASTPLHFRVVDPAGMSQVV